LGLPPARNKAAARKPELELIRPLTKAALAILESQRREGCTFVFSNASGRAPTNTFGRDKVAFDEVTGTKGWTLHDLRRTARSLMSRAGVNSDHAERCLGHLIGGVRGTYDRYEFYKEKAHAYNELAALIERIANPPKGNVTPLRKKKRA
jgi:integrase